MINPWNWLCNYRGYTFASRTKKMYYNDRREYLFNVNLRDVHHGFEGYIIQCFVYRKKVLDTYPYDYADIIRWNELMIHADKNLEILLERFKLYISEDKHKIKWFKNQLSYHTNKNEYDYILSKLNIKD